MTEAEMLRRAMLGADVTDRSIYTWLLYRYDGPWCGRKGPKSARCVLPPRHQGDHEGNGADEWGPRYERWEQSAAPLTWKTPRGR